MVYKTSIYVPFLVFFNSPELNDVHTKQYIKGVGNFDENDKMDNKFLLNAIIISSNICINYAFRNRVCIRYMH